MKASAVQIPIRSLALNGDLAVPAHAQAIILFAHGSGSSRHSPRNQWVARKLNDAGLATLLMDLLTSSEEKLDEKTRHLRFDIDLLAYRLTAAIDWLTDHTETAHLRIGLFGASTGAAAALVAAAHRPTHVDAVVSRGGRPDLAGDALRKVLAPTLLIVGGSDGRVIRLNQEAYAALRTVKALEIIPGATHLFEEPGKLEQVAVLARDWFFQHLVARQENAMNRVFRDRSEAGRFLAMKLTRYAHRADVMVLGLPRGGIPVAYEVARALSAPLEAFIVRKLGVPGQEELAMGAIASGGVRYLNRELIRHLDISNAEIEAITCQELAELKQREQLYRDNRPLPTLRGCVGILVDDGLATGASMWAAVGALRRLNPARIVIAVPVAAEETCSAFRDAVDEVVCASTPDPFRAVGQWYEYFPQVSDEEVRTLLHRQPEHA